jgi:hypothetical protein
MLKGSDIKGINTYHYTLILNTHKSNLRGNLK